MASPALSPEGQELLERTALAYRPIARAAALGRRNGTSLVFFGALSLLFSLSGFDLLGLAIGTVVLVTGLVEVRTSRRLAAADPAAPRILARNELVLMAGILTYCVLKLTVLRTSGSELSSQLGDTSALGIDVEALTESLNTTIYASFIAVTLIYQGGLARYFLRRRPMVDAYLRESPEWARKVVANIQD